MFTAKMRSDNRKTPQLYKVEYLTFDECKALTNHVNVLDRNGNIATVKVTTIKTWKRKPEIEIHCKYGTWEDETEEETRKEGLARLKEYRANMPQYAHKMITRTTRTLIVKG